MFRNPQKAQFCSFINEDIQKFGTRLRLFKKKQVNAFRFIIQKIEFK